MLKRCNQFAKIGTAICFFAIFIAALLCSVPGAEQYPDVVRAKLALTWWLAGGLVIFPLVAAVLWLGCAYSILVARAWRAGCAFCKR